MNSIYLIKTINLLGLIFVPLSYIFGIFGYNIKNGLIYLWLCPIGFSINYFHRQKSKLIFPAVIVLFLPLLAAKSTVEIICLAVYGITAILVILKGMGVVRYDIELDIFRKGIYLCLGTCIVSLVMSTLNIFISLSSYYVIVYLVSSVILLRNLRFIEYNRDSREGRRINNRYSIIIVILSSILCLSNVREIVIRIIKNSYLYIVDLFMHIFAWLFIGIGYLMTVVYNTLTALIEKAALNTQGLKQKVPNNKINSLQTKEGELLIDKIFNNQIFKIAVHAFIILLAVYIIMKIFKGIVNSQNESEEYSEEKEFMISSKEPDKKLKNRILDFMRHRSNDEKIRHYYQKYIKKCIDKDIEINETDTTEEIRDKSRNKFNKTIIDGIRNIYIKIRYGEKEASSETVREMADYYTNIGKK